VIHEATNLVLVLMFVPKKVDYPILVKAAANKLILAYLSRQMPFNKN
jgi:hypothetical protein